MHYVLILIFIILVEINVTPMVATTRERRPSIHTGGNAGPSLGWPSKRSVISYMFSRLKAPLNASTCRWLRSFRRQFKLCNDYVGFSTVILKARNLSYTHCKLQFEYERWNCSIQPQIFKRVYRETAYIYALTAAAITWSVAKACADKTLSYCGCALEKTPQETHDTWKWGGCGDNVKEGRKLTKKFLEMRKKGDGPHGILRHASEVGISTVKEEKTCICHGVSGTCTIKTCWMKVQPFQGVAVSLKDRYTRANRLAPGNGIRKALGKGGGGGGAGGDGSPQQQLYFLAEDRNLCDFTVGRRCIEPSNCATLCCSRGYTWGFVSVIQRCNCSVVESCCDVRCTVCEFTEKRYTCK